MIPHNGWPLRLPLFVLLYCGVFASLGHTAEPFTASLAKYEAVLAPIYGAEGDEVLEFPQDDGTAEGESAPMPPVPQRDDIEDESGSMVPSPADEFDSFADDLDSLPDDPAGDTCSRCNTCSTCRCYPPYVIDITGTYSHFKSGSSFEANGGGVQVNGTLFLSELWTVQGGADFTFFDDQTVINSMAGVGKLNRRRGCCFHDRLAYGAAVDFYNREPSGAHYTGLRALVELGVGPRVAVGATYHWGLDGEDSLGSYMGFEDRGIGYATIDMPWRLDYVQRTILQPFIGGAEMPDAFIWGLNMAFIESSNTSYQVRLVGDDRDRCGLFVGLQFIPGRGAPIYSGLGGGDHPLTRGGLFRPLDLSHETFIW